MASAANPRGGETTRRALVDAAAELFASQGVEAVSIRSVNSAAGQGPAAVHYHFGSKDLLLQAVLAQEGDGVLKRMQELAQRLARDARRPSAHDLVELLATPFQEMLTRDPVRGGRWLAICAQLSLSANPTRLDPDDAVTTLFRHLLRQAYPQTPEAVRDFNWSVAANTLIVVLGWWADGQPGVKTARSSASRPPLGIPTFGTLIEFVAGGLETAMMSPRASPAF